ncbi:hypothetical protein BpHYR1_000876 [Brachionus plicatilis]|uniref:Uncharacterized protein n=1 Tax=Brachionus plicatilis TaxID=10195 RepID=A0A3M7R7T1_BRAPC|nr:hypothetical protein BpHYR1_000876 [Brachionus plicatilis]
MSSDSLIDGNILFTNSIIAFPKSAIFSFANCLWIESWLKFTGSSTAVTVFEAAPPLCLFLSFLSMSS